ncbi:MAG TPA: alpha/beta hydrolase domain-containing protein, partial [Nevskiaceae bacterium]|nr:alpha/beta hydrolase domain-containing protein [Nevskiaceae bacterium]
MKQVLIGAACALLLAGCQQSAVPEVGGGSAPLKDAFPVARATVTGPIGDAGIHGHALWDSWFDLSELGYDEQEYFISGTAQVQPGGATAPYTTRIIVARPKDASRFNGTVVMDWVNVTAQFENAVDTTEAHDMMLREGYAYVLVSAQAAGLCCVPELTPKTWDPVRYMAISHPGDDWSFDMFAQVARALRDADPAGVDPMAGLPVQKVLAWGQSQSADRLYDYVNTGYADSRVIDGFIIHGGGSKFFDNPLPVPVIHLLSDREALNDTPTADPNYSLWEIAATAHTDIYVGWHQVGGESTRALADAPRQPASADPQLHVTAGNYGEQVSPLLAACIVAGSAMPMRYAVKASLHYLDAWVRGGPRPPQGARFEFDSSGKLAKDEHGNTRGGIRYPPVDVPVARYDSTACPLGGITLPFTDAQLAQLY